MAERLRPYGLRWLEEPLIPTDLEGHIEQPGVKKALEELGFHTETLDILGVYEASTFRQK